MALFRRCIVLIWSNIKVNIYCQAWCKAVENDSTFIIFHCGSLEVIGIRHRATQTLYLSDPIDVNHCQLPGYGSIQMALYMSILEDAKDRVSQQIRVERGSMLSTGKKRKRRQSGGNWFGSRKRHRSRKVTGKKVMTKTDLEVNKLFKIVCKC